MTQQIKEQTENMDKEQVVINNSLADTCGNPPHIHFDSTCPPHIKLLRAN